jgi:carboxyl-terminal processing protease
MEQEKVRKALEAMGVNWAAAPQGAPKGQARISAELRAPRTQAGDTMELAVTAHNVGTAPIYRLRAWTKSDNNILDRREFVFGELQPKEKRTWTVPVKVPRYVPSRRDDIAVKWEDDQGDALEDVHGESDIAELPRPTFAWSWQIVGKDGAPGDGLLHKGEQVEMVVDVKNIGVGKAYDAFAALKNMAEDRINVKKGRTKLGPLAPGEIKTATFILEVKKGSDDTPVPIRVELGDKETYEVERDKVMLPIGAALPSSPSAATVRLQNEAPVLAAPVDTADKLATAKKGSVLAAKGKVGNFYRVEWAKGRTGFVAAGAAKDAPGAKLLAKVTQTPHHEPPVIRVANLDTSHGGLEVDSDRFTISGSAADPNGMRDLQIFVQHENDYRKVFFKTARKAGQMSAPGANTLEFTTDLPLKPGNSTVYLIAREDDDLQAQRTIVIHRKVPAVAQAQKSRPAAQR